MVQFKCNMLLIYVRGFNYGVKVKRVESTRSSCSRENIVFFKLPGQPVDFHSDCYAVPGPSHWQYSDVTRRDWPAQIIDNNVA